MSLQYQSPPAQVYDLEERTAEFGENIINFCGNLPHNILTRSLISQLIRSATSIGANYMDANGASSAKDFRNKIFICRKEAQESKHWLRMLITASPAHKSQALKYLQEAHELVLIFRKITLSIDSKN